MAGGSGGHLGRGETGPRSSAAERKRHERLQILSKQLEVAVSRSTGVDHKVKARTAYKQGTTVELLRDDGDGRRQWDLHSGTKSNCLAWIEGALWFAKFSRKGSDPENATGA